MALTTEFKHDPPLGTSDLIIGPSHPILVRLDKFQLMVTATKTVQYSSKPARWLTSWENRLKNNRTENFTLWPNKQKTIGPNYSVVQFRSSDCFVVKCSVFHWRFIWHLKCSKICPIFEYHRISNATVFQFWGYCSKTDTKLHNNHKTAGMITLSVGLFKIWTSKSPEFG